MQAIFLTLTALTLASCGMGGSLPSQKSTSASDGSSSSSFRITDFFPPSGANLAFPANINLTFNESDLNALSFTALTHFNLVCGGVAFAATSVNYSGSSEYAVVTMPSAAGVAVGTKCQFIVSSNVQTTAGTRLGGVRFAEYTIQ